MGLSIAYQFAFRGTKTELLGRLKRLREEFRRLPVCSVEEIVEIEHASVAFGPEGRDIPFIQRQLGIAMLFTQLGTPVSNQGRESWRRHMDRIGRSGNGFSFCVDVDEGCEYFQVILGRLGRGRLWYGIRTTKTQYAKRFVESHLIVIRMLELCRDAGILRRVCDDGRYWETRDLAVLAERLNASEEMLKVVAAALTMGARIRVLDCRVAGNRHTASNN